MSEPASQGSVFFFMNFAPLPIRFTSVPSDFLCPELRLAGCYAICKPLGGANFYHLSCWRLFSLIKKPYKNLEQNSNDTHKSFLHIHLFTVHSFVKSFDDKAGNESMNKRQCCFKVSDLQYIIRRFTAVT